MVFAGSSTKSQSQNLCGVVGRNRRWQPRRLSCSTYQMSPRSANNVELHIFRRAGASCELGPIPAMPVYRFTQYFEHEVLRKRSYLRKNGASESSKMRLSQLRRSPHRYRFRGPVPELDGRYLRVITLENRVTIHNAFPDRRFRP